MNCVHGVRMDRDCRWCSQGETGAALTQFSGSNSEVARLRSALKAAERERDEAQTSLAELRALASVEAASRHAALVEMTAERDKALAAVDGDLGYLQLQALIKERDLLADAVTQYRDQRDAALKRAETAESTAHGLRLLQGTTDEVAVGLIRERDEARTALLDLADKAGAELNVARSERDAARLEAGRLAQELVEVTGKLALAEVEVGRLREEREHDRKWIEHVRKQCGVTGDGSIIELVQGLRAAVESIRIASDGFERCEVIGESSVALKQQLGWINARARQALKPKEVAGG